MHKKGVELALGLETAARYVQELQKETTNSTSGQTVVHQLSMSSVGLDKGAAAACWRCRKKTYKKIECCLKPGYLASSFTTDPLLPHSTTGVTPTELLLGCKLRSWLHLLHPDLGNRVIRRQHEHKLAQGQQRWVPACVVQLTSPLSHMLELEDGTPIP